jgi:anti-sigma factor RsiW
MNCARVRRVLALLAGGDLPEKKARKLRVHLERCPGCRKEWDAYRAAFETVKGLAGAEEVRDWDEAEWRRMLWRITAASPEPRRNFFGLSPARALAVGLAFAAAVLGLNILTNRLAVGPPPRPSLQADARAGAPGNGQDVLTMTWVSPETGLKIVWFFNKNLTWED